MLKAAPAKASLVVCSTCRYAAEAREDAAGRRGGEILASTLADVLAGHLCRDRIALQQTPCLFACGSHCTAFLRSEGRLGYILVKLAPTRDDALALLDFAARYLESADGVVPYAEWPEGVKGHFLARLPPENFVWDPPVALSNADTIATPEPGA